MRLAVIGNSHIGSLLRSWHDSLYKKYGNVDITFFGCPANGLDGLELEGRSLVENNQALKDALIYVSRGTDRIDLDKYDAFVIYGLGLHVISIDKIFYSNSFLLEIAKCNFRKGISAKISDLIRGVTDAKIYYGHNPLVAKRGKNKSSSSNVFYSSYYEGVSFANKMVYSLLNSELILQPKKTLTEDGLNTLIKYSVGSKRLDFMESHKTTTRYHPSYDVGHMNDEFGYIWLDEFLKGYIEVL